VCTLTAVNSESCLVISEVSGRSTHRKKMSDFSNATLCDCLIRTWLVSMISISLRYIGVMFWNAVECLATWKPKVSRCILV
jgi:hypothetical protein